MPLVTNVQETRAFLDVLRRHEVAVPCFCTENAWTTEAVLEATRRTGERFGLAEPPVVIGFTAAYHGRSNLRNYWTSGDMELGFLGALGDLRVLMAPCSPYARCRVFLHLDHGQPEEDRWLIEGRLDDFAMVMFDASALPLEENIRLTREYVRRFSDRVVIEGAVAELKEASSEGEDVPLTTPDQARRFVEQTGCDLIVPNVGTEHRSAAVGRAFYRQDRAREIAAAAGRNLVLHGTSCMGDADLSGLPHDGVVKVNVWTIIEKVGGKQVAEYVLENAGRLLEKSHIEDLRAAHVVGEKIVSAEQWGREGARKVGPDINYFPLINLRRRWVGEVADMLTRYFEMFGYDRLPKQAGPAA